MPLSFVLATCLIIWPVLSAKHRTAPPAPISEFEIGQLSFWDFGPPFAYYGVYRVQATTEGTQVERVGLTPHGGSCMQPAKIEVSSASIKKPIDGLLHGTDPCQIPDEKLQRELKRCKKCLTFSGAITVMRFKCGTSNRLVSAKILDRDIYDSAPNTPQYASWTMQLLSDLDNALGSRVADKPVFDLSDRPPSQPSDSPMLEDVRDGKFDDLFQGERMKPSDLYREALKALPSPDVDVTVDSPLAQKWLARTNPVYPPIARAAHVEGSVVLTFRIDEQGNVADVVIVSGHPLLRQAVEKAVKTWKFEGGGPIDLVRATVKFVANCPTNQS